LDEVSVLLKSHNPAIFAITESWLTPNIPDQAVSMDRYSVQRRDRRSGSGGGVMLYLSDTIHCRRLENFESHDFEVLWVALRPKILPRPVSILLVAVVYCPPSYDVEKKRELANFILDSVDRLVRKYPSAGIFICGDFNTLDTGLFNRYLHLNQLITSSTRGNNLLDKFFTNCKDHYRLPTVLAPVGKSDHNCILIRPNFSPQQPVTTKTVFQRRLNLQARDNIAKDLSNTIWQDMYCLEDCQLQANFFYQTLLISLNNHAPLELCSFKSNDRPWITSYFKKIISERNEAFKNGKTVLYKKLRNKVNRVRKSLQKQFYLNNIDNLKADNPAKWWKHLKSICKFNNKQDCTFEGITYRNEIVSMDRLPNILNNFFVSVGDGLPALDLTELTKLRQSLGPVPDRFVVDPFEVFTALNHLSLTKSPGPDLIPNLLLKDLAAILAEPICALINSSVKQGIVPDWWKMARITPLPKQYPPTTVEQDVRPIAITNSIAKIAERFVAQWFNEHFSSHLDSNQFGCTTNRSTTHALIKLTHEIFKASDNSNNLIRILFVDFSKAFDLIDHNILLQKFIKYEFPPHISVWSLSFLHDRQQFVKVNGSASIVLGSNAGTPQGTISGPNDFKLLINDLDFDGHYAKYVDDASTLSVSTNPHNFDLQNSANRLIDWTQANHMRVNEAKTKEMLIYFGSKHKPEDVPNIEINSVEIERVLTFKLLGVVVSADLSWTEHVDYILKKVAKRMYCMHYLVRAGIKETDIIIIYCSIIRSVLEYACPVWHPGLSQKQSEDIERVQKRCLKLIFPGLSYEEALVISGLEKLETRRENQTRDLFLEIKNENHVLHSLLPYRDTSSLRARNPYPFIIPITKPTRYGRAFIPYCISKRY